MNRREMMGALGLGAAALTTTAVSARADDAEDAMDDHIKVMGECALLCNMTAHHCLEAIKKKDGDAAMHAKVHELAMDCQEFCVLSITLMARHSPLSKYAHEANAQACTDLANAAEKHKDSELVQKCAEQARECAKVCKDLSQHGHHHE